MGARLSRLFPLLRRVLALPPRAVARKVVERVGGGWQRSRHRARDRRAGTFGETLDGALQPLLDAPPAQPLLAANRDWIEGMAALHLEHRFDLLGSGWVRQHHGMACPGVAGHRYDGGPAVTADTEGAWLGNRMVAANHAPARALWRLIEGAYQPIDWHLDFKSGYRWAETLWHADVPIGHRPGVDVKVPWEMARMHHLTTLALCFGLDGGKGARAEDCRREFRNQILDFTATNPPRFGVNWRCPMDVAIRAVNWIVAYELFRGFGARFDESFETALRDSLYRHGAHVFGHLEWDPQYRSNHFLADICGLLFIAAILPHSAETDDWLAFAVKVLSEEADFQFLPDGGNFEASTAYHRLSTEMLVYGVALALGLSDGKRAVVRSFLPAGVVGRLARAAAFSAGLEKANGRMPQIGDNDSGRLLKIAPAVSACRRDVLERRYLSRADDADLSSEAVLWDEDPLDHRHLQDAVSVLFEDTPPASLDAAVIRALASGVCLPRADTPAVGYHGDALPPVPAGADRTIITVPDAGLMEGLETRCWPDFGLFLFRSERVYLLVRCGPVGQNGRGGHAHNDQLAIELAIDGEDWIADPGSYLYTPDRRARDAYRSVYAHAAPRRGDREPARLDLGDFWLEDSTRARCLAFGPGGFAGSHDGYGETITRWVRLHDDHIEIVDAPGNGRTERLDGAAAVRAALAPAIPFSPGYGLQMREE